jgi:WXG100 family type VII secretion target
MSNIRVNTEGLSQTGVQFDTKRQELEALNSQAQGYVSALQGEWQGIRATRFFGEWQVMEGRLLNAIETLQEASTLLKRASADFSAADTAF